MERETLRHLFLSMRNIGLPTRFVKKMSFSVLGCSKMEVEKDDGADGTEKYKGGMEAS